MCSTCRADCNPLHSWQRKLYQLRLWFMTLLLPSFLTQRYADGFIGRGYLSITPARLHLLISQVRWIIGGKRFWLPGDLFCFLQVTRVGFWKDRKYQRVLLFITPSVKVASWSGLSTETSYYTVYIKIVNWKLWTVYNTVKIVPICFIFLCSQ